MKLDEYLGRWWGDISEFAREYKLPRQCVQYWKDGKLKVPLNRCIEIEKATNGVVTCEEMRPDVDWGYLRGSNKKTKAEVKHEA